MAQTPGQNKASTQVDPAADDVHPVIVVSVDSRGGKRNGKKKKGSSKASRRLEDIENRASKSLRRVTRAVNKGVRTYREKRKKSERRRRDGALVDCYENASVGIAQAVAQSSPVLTDIAKACNTRRRRKQIRRLVRSFPVL